jgi:CheY-like chemotaxis protein
MKEKYLNEGFDEYLSKPIQKEELNLVLQKYLVKN